MNKLYTLLILALLLGTSSLNAQTPTLKAYQKYAKKAVQDKDFYSAWQFNKIALKIDSTNMNNMYNLAEAARQFKSYEVAKDAYQKVLESENKADFPLTEFWLGDVYHHQGNYDLAISHYQRYLNRQVTPKGPSENPEMEYTVRAKKAIENCNWAKQNMEGARAGYKVKPFGNGVNTPGTEFAPIEHQNQLYYSGMDYDKENFCPDPNSEVTRLYTTTDTYEGQAGAINWAKEEKGKFVAHTAFNGDGSRVYFTICNRANASEFDCEIFYRNKNNGMWGDAVRLSETVNQAGSSNTQPSIGFDDNTGKELLFFASNRADEVGGANEDFNIYCSIIELDGNVSAPAKLDINTDEDDITPFYNKKNNTLYFSSNGRQGYGGFDIYYTKKTGSSFSEPQPMALPVNSSYDDIYFSTDPEYKNSYFSTNRLGVICNEEDEGLETCCNDIYKLDVIQVDLIATTFNELVRTALDSCNTALYDVATGKELEAKFNPTENDFYFPLDLEKDYMVVSRHEGRWTMDTTFVSTKGIVESTRLTTELELMPNIDLIANTFDKSTGEPLNGCTFEFFDNETGELIVKTDRIDDNQFEQWLVFGREYKVVASKPNYSSDEVSFTTNGFSVPTSLRERLELEPCDLGLDLSVELFFDNDEPDKRTRDTITKLTYLQSFEEYTKDARIEKFLEENGKNLYGENKIKAQELTQIFFDDKVKEGMVKLDLFAQFLERYLPQGRIYQLEIEGVASPRAPSSYNVALTKRRVSSVENYLRTFNNGALAPYIGATNNLRIITIPRGEDPSQGRGIPSKYGDPKSIYSIEASEQRKVEFVRIRRIDDCGYTPTTTVPKNPTPEYPTTYPPAKPVISVDLIANTFDRTSRAELSGCTFRFVDESTGATILETEKIDDNRFYSLLEFDKRYRVIASKTGYSSDEVSFTTNDLTSSRTFRFPLYLEPSYSGAELPVILYFDNDEPDKRTRATSTTKTYEETYRAYVQESRVQTYLSENGKNLTGESKLKAQDETRIFFEGRVREGMNRLEMLAQFLERSLPQGKKYQIELEGFASPRAPSEYNQKLTLRRTSSVENYLRTYNGGVLAPYIGLNKSLNIKLVPRGEQQSTGLGIPSQYSDPKSIYSIEASEQRKVTIVRLKSME